MTNRDSAQFAQLFALLSQSFDKPVSEAMAQVYFDNLKDFPIEQVATAVQAAIRTKTFFPKVAELRQLIEGSVEDRAAQAWAALLEAAADGGQASVRFADRAAALAMDAVFGSWTQACRLLSAGNTDERGRQVGGCSDEMAASYQKAFARQYVGALNSSREVVLYRPGLSEMAMRENGGGWAARMPTLKQPVIFIGAGKAVTLRLAFDVAQGCLTEESRALLNSGWEAVQGAVAAESRRLRANAQKALKPAPDGEMATPEEVEALKQSIARWPSVRKAIAERSTPAQVVNIADAKKEHG